MAKKTVPIILSNNKDITISWLLVWCRHKSTLTIHQMRLILRILEFCQAELKGLKIKDNLRQLEYENDDVLFKIPVSDVYFSDFSLKSIRADLKDLRERTIEFYEYETKVWSACGIIEKPHVYERTGMMEFKVDLQFWKVLLNLTHGIRKCELSKALMLPTVYSMWFYMYISEKSEPQDITIVHLKERLGIQEGEYKDKNGMDRIDNLEARVIKPAQKALNESCPYTFRYEKIRENPNNKRSPVKLFRFIPVKQSQFRDENLERKALMAKTSVSMINQQVIDYMIQTMGFELKEVQSNKELLQEATRLIPNLPDKLRDIQNRRRLGNKDKGWIINALKGNIEDIKRQSGSCDVKLDKKGIITRNSGYIADLFSAK